MTSSESLGGKHVFVIGGASGIGLRTAMLAADMGAKITVGGNDRDRLASAREKLSDARAIELDIADRRSVEAAFSSMTSIDHLVITAASWINGKLAESDPDHVLGAVRERVFGVVYAIRAALPLLTPASSIVLTSGVISLRPMFPGNAVMAASIGAVEALVRGLALELQPVRVNAVAPGVTDSTFFTQFDKQSQDALFAKAAGSNLVKRVGTVDEIASAYIFLMINEFMTGEILRIDGGARVA